MLHYSFCKGQDNRTNIPKRDVDRFRSHLRAINTDTPQHKGSRAKECGSNEDRRRGEHGGSAHIHTTVGKEDRTLSQQHTSGFPF